MDKNCIGISFLSLRYIEISKMELNNFIVIFAFMVIGGSCGYVIAFAREKY
jgi:hypothetical protein